MIRRIAVLALVAAMVPWATPGSGRAGELAESPEDPSAFATVINARDYDDRFESVEDVLQHVAGVRVRRFGGPGSQSTASIRGSKSEQVLILVDGMRLNSAQRGSVDLSSLNLRAVDTIEVLRGGGSARYGSDAMGGVISIRSRKDAEAGVDAKFTTGSLDTLGADLFVTPPPDDKLSATVGYSRLSSENEFRFDYVPDLSGGGGVGGRIPVDQIKNRHDRLNADYVQDSGLLNLTQSLGRTSELAISSSVFYRDRGQPGTTGGKRPNAKTEELHCLGAEDEYRRALGGVKWRESSFAAGSLELSSYHRYEKFELHDPGFCFSNRLVSEETRTNWHENQTAGEALYAGRRRNLGPFQLQTRASLGARYDRVSATDSDVQRRATGTAFVQQDLRFFEGVLRVIPALGFEAADTSEGKARSARFLKPVEVDPDDDAEWIPRVGAIVELGQGLRFKSNYLRAYRRPNFNELFHPDQGLIRGNPTLEAEDGWNFDVGFEFSPRGGGPVDGLRLETAYFHRDIEESIEWLYVGGVYQPVNTGRARADGVEVGGTATLFERLELSANYTYLDTEIRDVPKLVPGDPDMSSPDLPLPHSPEHQVFASAAYPLGPVRVWTQYTYEDEIALGASQLPLKADSWYQIDLGLSLRPAELPLLRWAPPDLSLGFEWLNLNRAKRVDSLGLPLADDTLWYLTVRGQFR